MTDAAPPTPGPPPSKGVSRWFVFHAATALLLLVALNVLVASYVPFAIQGIGSSYLIM